jgi:hypothetical protein
MDYSSVARMVRASSRMLRERLSDPHEGTFTHRTFLEIERQRQAIFETPMPTFVRECYSSLVDIARQMQTIARTRGFDLFVVLAPDEIQVERSLQMEVSRTFASDPANYDYGALPSRLANDLERAGVATLNLQSAFEARGTTEALYAVDDTHWNEAGNLVAAGEIWTFLHSRWAFDNAYRRRPPLLRSERIGNSKPPVAVVDARVIFFDVGSAPFDERG